jgi:hypothetical protein
MGQREGKELKISGVKKERHYELPDAPVVE